MAAQQALAQGEQSSAHSSLSPHARSLVSDAFYEMLDRKQDQAMIIM